MLVIRLQRIGKKKSPSYRIIVSEKTKDTQAGTLENLGIYNPVLKDKVIELNKERINYWISVGAQPSASVNNLLVREGVIKGDKHKSVFLSKKRKEKMGVKKTEAEEAKVKAKEAADAKVREEAELIAKAKEEEAVAKAAVEKKEEVVEAPVEEVKEPAVAEAKAGEEEKVADTPKE